MCPSEGRQHGVSILSSANFSRTFRQLTQQRNTVQISDLVKLFSCVSFITLQILGLFHQLVLILMFYVVTVKTKNRIYCTINVLCLNLSDTKFLTPTWLSRYMSTRDKVFEVFFTKIGYQLCQYRLNRLMLACILF